MPHEADFCGDRLRLSAFLRVVSNGMPKRPTRFRRRLRAVDNGLQASTHHDTDRTDDTVTAGQKVAHEKPFNDMSIFDTLRSPSPEQPRLAPENPLPETTVNSGRQRYCEQPEDVGLPIVQQQAGNRTPTTTITKSPKKACKISSTRKRRQLPVNELTLVRTTSLDGLPQPSDADYIFAAPVAAVDPIADSQILSCAPSKTSPQQLVVHRIQKPLPTKSANTGPPVWILRGQFGHPHLAKLKGSRSKLLSSSTFATGSDGFVGAELSIQPTKRSIKPRANKKTQLKRSGRDGGGLVLVCGHLLTPPVEHHASALTVAERPLHMGSRTPLQAPTRVDERQPSSKRAVAEIRKAVNEREAKERRDYSPRQESLVRVQLSSITAPVRRISEGSSSEYLNEERIPSNVSDSDNDNAHDASQSPHNLSSGCMHSLVEDTGYFQSATHILDAAERSDSVDEEFWSQYPEVEYSDGYWLPESGAMGSVHYK